MWKEIFGYSIERADAETLWREYNKPDDDYVQHALGMEAILELIRRGEVENIFAKKGLTTGLNCGIISTTKDERK